MGALIFGGILHNSCPVGKFFVHGYSYKKIGLWSTRENVLKVCLNVLGISSWRKCIHLFFLCIIFQTQLYMRVCVCEQDWKIKKRLAGKKCLQSDYLKLNILFYITMCKFIFEHMQKNNENK